MTYRTLPVGLYACCYDLGATGWTDMNVRASWVMSLLTPLWRLLATVLHATQCDLFYVAGQHPKQNGVVLRPFENAARNAGCCRKQHITCCGGQLGMAEALCHADAGPCRYCFRHHIVVVCLIKSKSLTCPGVVNVRMTLTEQYIAPTQLCSGAQTC